MLERNADNMFDIIFMDCNMPFKDGPTASAEIRRYINSKICENIEVSKTQGKWRQPLIVAVTGHTEEGYVKEALKSGMNSVIGKPATTKKIQMVLFEGNQIFKKYRD